MATAAASKPSEAEQISDEEYIKCFLCKKNQTEPKLLNCKHSFCRCCLEHEVSKTDYDNIFHCPICKYVTILFKEDISKFPDNYLIDALLEVGTFPETLTCIGCDATALPFEEGYRCLDCGDTYCSKCQEFHCFSSLTKKHKVVSVKKLQEGVLKKARDETNTCKHHSTPEAPQVLDMVCRECGSLICQVCTTSSHRYHGCTKLGQQIAPIKQEMKSSIEAIPVNAERTRHILMEDLKQLKEKKKEQEDKVYVNAEKLFQMCDKAKQEKLGSVQKYYDDEIKRLEEILQREGELALLGQSTITFATKFINKTSDVDFFENCKTLSQELHTIKDETESFFVSTQFLEVESQDSDTLKWEIMKVLGMEEMKVETKHLHGTEKKSKKTTGVMIERGGLRYPDLDRMSITEDGEVILTAVTRSGIRGLCFCDKSYKPKRFVHYPKSWEIDDIVFKDKKIYLSDVCTHAEKVYILDSVGFIQKSIHVPKRKKKSLFLGLAVNDSGTIYVCSSANNTIFKCERNENRFQHFLSRKDFNKLQGPHCLCIDKSQNLVVSNYKSGVIQVFDGNGEIIWDYKHESLVEPFGVCSDENDRILIASNVNSQIHVVDSNSNEYYFINLRKGWHPMAVAPSGGGQFVVSLMGDYHKRQVEARNAASASYGDNSDEEDYSYNYYDDDDDEHEDGIYYYRDTDETDEYNDDYYNDYGEEEDDEEGEEEEEEEEENEGEEYGKLPEFTPDLIKISLYGMLRKSCDED